MEKEIIIEGNKLILDFLKVRVEYNQGIDEEWVFLYEVLEINNCRVSELKFHYSWDWLMPVVEKICRLKIGNGETTVEYAYPRTFGMLISETGQIMVRLNGFALVAADTLIEATWLAVVGFIKYFNELSANKDTTPTIKMQEKSLKK